MMVVIPLSNSLIKINIPTYTKCQMKHFRIVYVQIVWFDIKNLRINLRCYSNFIL